VFRTALRPSFTQRIGVGGGGGALKFDAFGFFHWKGN
jgi:hypothetical protein